MRLRRLQSDFRTIGDTKFAWCTVFDDVPVRLPVRVQFERLAWLRPKVDNTLAHNGEGQVCASQYGLKIEA